LTKHAKLFALGIGALIIDQTTKAIALLMLLPGQPVPLLRGLNLTLVFNKGASFGMLGDVMAGRPLTMAALTGAITLAVAVLAFRSPRMPEASGLALIAGGSAGNVIDRLRHGAVTDYLDLYWGEWHWPTFNFADVFITSGVAMLLIASLSQKSTTDR
jgi:signal peptidase II